jgi:hypothetical protein
MSLVLRGPQGQTTAPGGFALRADRSSTRAASIAGRLLGLVESGYFERLPPNDEDATATWLTNAISELDQLFTGCEPTESLDRLDALIVELPQLAIISNHFQTQS